MRATIRISDTILKQAKKLALEKNISLNALIEEVLQEKLMQMNQHQKKKPVTIITVKGNGLLPGVDLDNTADLLELME